MLFAEPQKLLCGHLRQNQFQPGDLDALLLMRHKKSQRMLIFPKWDWGKIKIAKKFWKPGQLEVDQSELSDWPSITRAASEFNPLFRRPHLFFFVALIFSLQPCFCRFWRDSLFAERDFYSQRLQRSVPVCSRCFYRSCVFCWMLKWWLLLYCREYQQSLTYY